MEMKIEPKRARGGLELKLQERDRRGSERENEVRSG